MSNSVQSWLIIIEYLAEIIDYFVNMGDRGSSG
jgi:hypothetical protein